MSSIKRLTIEELPFTLTVEEMADLLGISIPKAYETANSKGFPVLRIGRRMIIPRDAFIEWIKDNVGVVNS